MKPALLLFAALICIATAGLTSCADFRKTFGGLKVGACYDGACVNVEIPKADVTESGKEVRPVE